MGEHVIDVRGLRKRFGSTQALEDALRTRGTGMSRVESTSFVRALSALHADWSAEMVRSLARTSSKPARA